MAALAAIVLAAGKGVRMKSDLPKVFHEILGEPMLTYVLRTVQKLTLQKTLVVVGHQRQLIMDYYKDWPVEFVVQAEQLGTGHAVMQAEPYLKDFAGTILVLAGDVPLISEQTLRRLVEFHEQKHAAVTDLTAVLPDAGNYGRIVRKENGELLKIVEKKGRHARRIKHQGDQHRHFLLRPGGALLRAARSARRERAARVLLDRHGRDHPGKRAAGLRFPHRQPRGNARGQHPGRAGRDRKNPAASQPLKSVKFSRPATEIEL